MINTNPTCSTSDKILLHSKTTMTLFVIYTSHTYPYARTRHFRHWKVWLWKCRSLLWHLPRLQEIMSYKVWTTDKETAME